LKQNDLNWFEPMYRRVMVLAVCVGWAAFEFWRGDQTWGWIMAAFSAYTIWTFFITFDSKLEKKGKDDGQPPPPAA
jgi:hypothetical protein